MVADLRADNAEVCGTLCESSKFCAGKGWTLPIQDNNAAGQLIFLSLKKNYLGGREVA